jgi:hypothetical protein
MACSVSELDRRDLVHPRKRVQDIDWYAKNAAGDELDMQVVRASDNEQLWREMNRGSIEMGFNSKSAARELIAVIQKKSAKYSSAQKEYLTLVIDAGRTPSHTFQNVFNAFRIHHLEECKHAGFKEVWAVGPHEGLVEKLWEQREA